jgi:hypothetical protein
MVYKNLNYAVVLLYIYIYIYFCLGVCYLKSSIKRAHLQASKFELVTIRASSRVNACALTQFDI